MKRDPTQTKHKLKTWRTNDERYDRRNPKIYARGISQLRKRNFTKVLNTTSPKTTNTQRKLFKDCITKKKYAQNFLVRAFELFYVWVWILKLYDVNYLPVLLIIVRIKLAYWFCSISIDLNSFHSQCISSYSYNVLYTLAFIGNNIERYLSKHSYHVFTGVELTKNETYLFTVTN